MKYYEVYYYDRNGNKGVAVLNSPFDVWIKARGHTFNGVVIIDKEQYDNLKTVVSSG